MVSLGRIGKAAGCYETVGSNGRAQGHRFPLIWMYDHLKPPFFLQLAITKHLPSSLPLIHLIPPGISQPDRLQTVPKHKAMLKHVHRDTHRVKIVYSRAPEKGRHPNALQVLYYGLWLPSVSSLMVSNHGICSPKHPKHVKLPLHSLGDEAERKCPGRTPISFCVFL